jgi:uncharacterized protein (TIGR00730 family)
MKENIYQQDPWRIFRILAEFVEGFDKMLSIGPSVSFFGSSRIETIDTPYYNLANEIAKKVAQKGFSVITGGGYGIMEAANKGAQEAHGKSCGLCINFISQEHPNAYIDHDYLLKFRHFFVRKVMFVKYTQGFVVLPGGFGTLDELFESLTLIHTHKINRFPIFLVGKNYWQGLLDWLKNTVAMQKNISLEALESIIVTDDPDEIANKIKEHYEKTKHLENF